MGYNLGTYILIKDQGSFYELMEYFESIGIDWRSGRKASEYIYTNTDYEEGLILHVSSQISSSYGLALSYLHISDMISTEDNIGDYEKEISVIKQKSAIEIPSIIKTIKSYELEREYLKGNNLKY